MEDKWTARRGPLSITYQCYQLLSASKPITTLITDSGLRREGLDEALPSSLQPAPSSPYRIDMQVLGIEMRVQGVEMRC